MSQVPDLDALLRAERAVSPAASAVNHGWLKLSQDLAANVAPLAVTSGPLQSVYALVAKWLLSGMVLGLVGGGAVVLATPRSSFERPPLERSARNAQLAKPVPVAVAPASAAASVMAEPANLPQLAAASRASANTGASSAAAEPTTFDAELALITRAKSELDARQFSAAEASLHEHAARFPAGVFATERAGLLVLTSCERGPKNPSLAQQFANLHPGAPIRARLSSACGAGPSPAPSGVLDFSKLSNDSTEVGERTTEPRTGNSHE